jgi:O-methyltransferase
MKSFAKSLPKSLLSKLGVLSYLRRLRLLADKGRVPGSIMRFPTYDLTINHTMALAGDYCRYATIGLAIQRILSEDIKGDLAEVGVYRGDISRFIHQLASERIYYLFDTFEGFPRQDLEPNVSEDNRFRDTTVKEVLQKIGDTRNIIIKKGYVPDTFQGLENERFAFVLLDLDLYNPTVSSLGFFYPRLVKGGYLMVHDYNSPESNWACKRAVNKFMRDKTEKIIEIADEWGSVLFRKL